LLPTLSLLASILSYPGFAEAFLTFPLSDAQHSLYHGWYYSPKHLHKAIDIKQPLDASVLAAAPGLAISSCQPYLGDGNDTFGLFVLVHHDNGYSTLYAHLNSTLLPTESQLPCDGQSRFRITSTADIQYGGHTYRWTRVDRGQEIGRIGKSGTTYYHLHFQVAVDPVGAYAKNARGVQDRRVDPYTLYSTAEVYPPPDTSCSNIIDVINYLWTQCPPAAPTASSPGLTWSQKSTYPSPSARTGHAMVYDSYRQEVVLFGGDSTGETWIWDGANWQLRSPVNSPPPRTNPAMAYDAARH
jgi:murein DD-endopeptidase MepM/ murein hydrolase activator NlpD